jgi:KDO2-lipid IV(A) lauroyltransferase
MSRTFRRWFKDTVYGVSVRAVRIAVRSLSDDAALALGRRLGRWAYRLLPSEAGRARRQLLASFPDKTAAEAAHIAGRVFEHFGMTAAEVLRFGRLRPDNVRDYVSLVGAEHMDRALAAGRGFLGLTAHFGNWELLAAALVLYGYPVSALARPLRSRTLQRLVAEQRGCTGVQYIPRDSGLREAVRALARNRALGVLADVDTDVQGVFVQFFGRPAHTPVGPVLLSQRYGAPALPMFLYRVDGPRHRLEVHPPIKWQDTGDAAEDLRVNVARYAQVIEAQIRRAPEQWIWTHDRWKTRP